MRLSLIRIGLVAVLAALGAPSAMAQTRPGFWEISIEAAANAELGSPIAPIILGNALAESRDPKGARPVLTRLQLMLSYIALNQFDLFKGVYGTPDLKIDVSKFDPDLKDYISALKTFQEDYSYRLRNPSADDKGVRLEALRYGAEHLAEIEVALLKKIASDDTMELAYALVSKGVVLLRVYDDYDKAMTDYQSAEDLLLAKRREHRALISAERAFAMGGEQVNGHESESERGIENFITSEDEPNVPLLIIQNAVFAANHMIENGDLAEAKKYLRLALSAKATEDGINKFMTRIWTCHPVLAWSHMWRALIVRSKMTFASKQNKEVSGNRSRKFGLINSEYQRALEIELFSHGGVSDDFKEIAESYLSFLKEAGHEEDAKRFEATSKTMGDADVGTGGPEEWQNVLNCPEMSR
jgi:tetratricopeptide (TPR) repeat protein